MSRMLSLLSISLLLSCSILEDSDVTETDELKQLTLKSITIEQALNTSYLPGTANTSEFQASSVPVGVLSTGMMIKWPSMPDNSKIKFKSGAKLSVTIKNLYYTTGQLYSCTVYESDVLKEEYIFQYDGFRPKQLDTNIVNATNTVIIKDLLKQDVFGGQGDIIRDRGYGLNKRDTIRLGTSRSSPCEGGFNFSLFNDVDDLKPFDKQIDYNLCEDILYQNSESVYLYWFENELVQEMHLENSRAKSDGNCCSDIYYFHPIFMIPSDPRLKVMYAVDWWEIKASTSSDKDQSVNLKFNYGL